MKRLTVLAAVFAGLTTSAAHSQEAPVDGAAIFASATAGEKPAEAVTAETATAPASAPVQVSDRGQFGLFAVADQAPASASNEAAAEKVDNAMTASAAEPDQQNKSIQDEPTQAAAQNEPEKAVEQASKESEAEKVAKAPVPQKRPELVAAARKATILAKTGDPAPTSGDKKLIADAKKSAETKVAALGTGKKYHEIVSRYASAYGVPVTLAHAVISIESNYRANATGRAGEVGLMQIKPATARMMGFSGSAKALYNPETNIKYGLKYLGKARELGGGTTCGTILKYNAGHGAKRMNPVSAAYCSKVKRQLGSA